MKKNTYTVWLYANEAAQYKLDGVHVYDPVQDDSSAETLQAEAGEGNVLYVNLHDMLVNGGTDFTVSRPNGLGEDEAVDTSAISGVLFVDNAENIATESHWYKDTEDGEEVWHEQAKPIYANQFEAYKANSPNNEIYLATKVAATGETPEKAQAITFQVNAAKLSSDSEIYIGLSAPGLDKTKNQTANVTINGVALNPQVNSVMEMYYKVNYSQTDIQNGKLSVTILNDGNTMISVTNLKITNVPEAKGILGMPAADKKTAMRAFFLPVTTETVELAAAEPETVETEPVDPAVPEEPVIPAETPAPSEEPTVTPTPSVKNIMRQLISSFVSRLFNSVSRLFGF